MAKVQFSAIVNHVSGRLGDWVYSFQKGTAYIRAYSANPGYPNSQRQQQIKSIFSGLSSAWSSLSLTQKKLWNDFANSYGATLKGQTAFQRLNCHLLMASHSDLVTIFTPPKTPATPAFQTGFCAFIMSDSVTCISWVSPESASLYVMGHYRVHSSFCNNFPCYGFCPTVGYRMSQRFVGTVRSDALQLLHTHDWPAGTRLYYNIRSIDKFGRRSPVSHEIVVTQS
jgi:hypothetical protein